MKIVARFANNKSYLVKFILLSETFHESRLKSLLIQRRIGEAKPQDRIHLHPGRRTTTCCQGPDAIPTSAGGACYLEVGANLAIEQALRAHRHQLVVVDDKERLTHEIARLASRLDRYCRL